MSAPSAQGRSFHPPGRRGRGPDPTVAPRHSAFPTSGGPFVGPNPTFRSASQPFGVLTETAVDGCEALVREQTGNRSLVLFDRGDEVTVQAGENGIRFLLVSGKPLEEPVAWYGPIVMNTQEQLQKAFSELQAGTFLKR